MFNLQHNRRETLDLIIEFDQASGLPLLKEREKILQIVLTYVALPYTIAEYGCGKKCSIILHQLIKMGIPAYALRRGMVMEQDMSSAMLAESDYRKRPHALVIHNPLYHPKDFHQQALVQMLDEVGVRVDTNAATIRSGDFTLHHVKEVQFQQARSHIFPLITFWDDVYDMPVELILDPSIRPDALFDFEELREALSADEALIFSALPLAQFKLHQVALTRGQRSVLKQISPVLADAQVNDPRVIRRLNKADKGSIGDPETWTYANNLNFYTEHDRIQRARTGEGDLFYSMVQELLQARREKQGRVVEIRTEIERYVQYLQVDQVIRDDARWSEEALEPLALVENTISYYRALRQWLRWKDQELTLSEVIVNDRLLPRAIGLASRLRQRIERSATLSRDDRGVLDARAFTTRYNAVAIEVMQQMARAGLIVWIDAVGNIHGIRQSGSFDLSQLRNRAICLCSHIDTVNDAGKFDGRLGVLSGIEVLHILHDLQAYFKDDDSNVDAFPMMVSAFMGEEMTFTGAGVSMPGSAAVAGHASVEQIYRMQNGEGASYRDKLLEFLKEVQQQQQEGNLDLAIDFRSCSDEASLLEACADPQAFYTPYTYERHIEQGPVLDEASIPLALVETIMGIHQEDFEISGEQAEAGVLRLTAILRDLALDADADVRVTVGIMEGDQGEREVLDAGFALRIHLQGEKNHAGATRMQDRQDPGVAAARTMDFFFEAVAELNRTDHAALIPFVGELEIEPGLNRNVIPERVSVTLGVTNPDITDHQREYLMLRLQAFLVNRLTGTIAQGGEQIHKWDIEPIDFVSRYRRIRMSMDLRAGNAPAVAQFLSAFKEKRESLAKLLDLDINAAIHQELAPFDLSASGQVLQLERSYGGSHNPNEAQLMLDLLRGTLVQLAVTDEFSRLTSLDSENLWERVQRILPEAWKPPQQPFVSGALHDTCNIAARAQKYPADLTTEA